MVINARMFLCIVNYGDISETCESLQNGKSSHGLSGKRYQQRQDQFVQCLLYAWSNVGHYIVIISFVLFRTHNPFHKEGI